MKRWTIALVAMFSILCAVPGFAAQVRVFVADMNAIGVQNKDEMKATLQMLLSSRLNSDKIIAVSSAAEADVVVTGTYVTIGKVFSVDALAKTAAGKTITRAFVQGEGQDELIPAVGTLADKLSVDLVKILAAGMSPTKANTVLSDHGFLAAPNSDFIKQESQVRKAPVAEFIKPVDNENSSNSGWQSKRLKGAANLLAFGKNLPDGSREIFLADDHRLAYYRLSGDMKLVAETEFNNSDKIISVDTIDTADGALDIYVTIIQNNELNSEVWQIKGDKLQLVAAKLPYFFRSATLAGGSKKLYAQAMGREDDFFGDVAEATRNGTVIALKNQLKMPRFGTIYNFNQFHDQGGKIFTLVISPDGYLIVYDQQLNELWRSNDKFGGSELFFQKEDITNQRATDNRFRWVFMNQRIQVTSKNEILVGKNDGFWVLGNARSYKKGAIYNLVWQGSSLEEKWHTRETQNYMPDYYFDESRNELLMLQVVQRRGVIAGGASTLSIKKVE